MNTLAWTLIHFLWQGSLICVAYLILDLLVQSSTARVRYTVACLTLLLMALVPAGTFFYLLGQKQALLYQLPAAGSNPWLSSIVWSWIAGVAFFTARFLGAIAGTRRLRLSSSAAPTVCQVRTSQIAAKLGVMKQATLLLSSAITSPITFGWLRPVILIPASAVTQLPAELLEALIAHELAHIRRADYLINWLQNAIETVLFYHPAVWWLSRRIRELREFCCDDCVLELTADRGTYARALLQMEEIRTMPENLALAANGGELRRRIERILNPPKRRAPGAWMAVVVGSLVLGCSLLISAAETPQDKTKEEIEKRTAYAKAHFGSLEDKRSKTYIKLGPPDEKEVYENKSEKWRYKTPSVDIFFNAPDKSEAPKTVAKQLRDTHDSMLMGVHKFFMDLFHGGEPAKH